MTDFSKVIGDLDKVMTLLRTVREDMQRREQMPNRVTNRLDMIVATETGDVQPFCTMEFDPETALATCIDMHLALPEHVAEAEKRLLVVRNALTAATNGKARDFSTHEDLRRGAEMRKLMDEVARKQLAEHLGMTPNDTSEGSEE